MLTLAKSHKYISRKGSMPLAIPTETIAIAAREMGPYILRKRPRVEGATTKMNCPRIIQRALTA